MSSPVPAAYLVAAESASALVRDPAVADCWRSSSALEGMSVGALAWHLAAQVLNARELVAAGTSEQEAIPLLEHYARAAWVGADLDDEVNVGIRARAGQAATEGPTTLDADVTRSLAELEALLADGAPAQVLIPWQGWTLSLDDFLVTRMMEIVVHSDDLAVSVGIDTPLFPEPVLEHVLGLLTALSVRRHGQAAVVRALSRSERAPESIAAF